MKKFLSLVLALVMTMSLVTVGAGAADFTDDSSITYEEAVDVMTALGVVGGYADGSFGPKGTLTRGAAAKIICNLILGTTTADALVADSAPYSDVPVDNVFAGYIAYLAKVGVIGGYADGTFRPAATLTGYAFMKMLLGVIGLDASIEGYTGANWSIAVAKRALSEGVDLTKGLKGDFDGTKAVTREEACLYAFNAIKAGKFTYSTKSTLVVGDITVSSTSEAEQSVKTSASTGYAGAYFKDVFPKLTYSATGSDNADKFGRPAHTWYANKTKDKIGTYADTALAIYAGADFDDDTLDDDFDGYKTAGVDIIYNGGHDANVDMDHLEKSINGYTIEVYGDDDDKKIETIVVIEAYAAEITEVNTNDDDEIESVEVTVYEAGYAIANNGASDTLTIDVEDDDDAYEIVKGYEEDDVFAIFVTPGWDDEDADLNDVVLAAEDVETVEGEVTTISAGDYYSGWLKIDGTKYEFANEYSQTDVDKESEGVFYLYNGYVLHFDGEANKADDEYLYVVRMGVESDKWGNDTIYAEVVFADGTSKTVEINECDEDVDAAYVKNGGFNFDEGVYSYKYNEKKDHYDLIEVDTDSETVTITKGKTAIVSGDDKVATANSKTVFVNVKLDDGEFDKATVYTSYKKVATMNDATAYFVLDDGVAEYVFVIDAVAKNNSEDLVYIAGESVSDLVTDKDLGSYYTYNAVVGGEIVEIMVDEDEDDADDKDGLYDVASANDDGVYIDLRDVDVDSETSYGVNFKKASNEVVTLEDGDDKVALAYADDVTVFVIDTKGKITKGSINKNYSNVNVTYTTNSDDEVTCFYIEKLS